MSDERSVYERLDALEAQVETLTLELSAAASPAPSPGTVTDPAAGTPNTDPQP